jgi:hypothetical protein
MYRSFASFSDKELSDLIIFVIPPGIRNAQIFEIPAAILNLHPSLNRKSGGDHSPPLSNNSRF